MPVFADAFAWCSPAEFRALSYRDFKLLVGHLAEKSRELERARGSR